MDSYIPGDNYVDYDQGFKLGSPIATTYGEQFGAALSEGIQGPTAYAANFIQSHTNQTMTGKDATAQFGIKDEDPNHALAWKDDEMVNPDFAKNLQQYKIQKKYNDEVLAYGPQGTLGKINQFSGEFVGGFADPINDASMLLPTSWIGKGAEAALIAGRLEGAASKVALASKAIEANAWGRTGMAAINNGAVVGMMQPLVMAGAHADHEDYGFADAANQILFGAAFGGAAHGLGELGGSLWRGLTGATASKIAVGEDVHPDMIKDLESTSPKTTTDDLKQTLGRDPSQEEVDSEVVKRQQNFIDKSTGGGYQLPDPKEPSNAVGLPKEFDEAVASGDKERAASIIDADTRARTQDLPMETQKVMQEKDAQTEAVKKAFDDLQTCLTS